MDYFCCLILNNIAMAKQYIKQINQQIEAFFQCVQTMHHEDILDAMGDFLSHFKTLHEYVEKTSHDILTNRYIDQFTKDASNFSDMSLDNVMEKHHDDCNPFHLIVKNEMDARKEIETLRSNAMDYFHGKTSSFVNPESKAPWIRQLAREYQSTTDAWIKNRTLAPYYIGDDPVKLELYRRSLIWKLEECPKDFDLVIKAIQEFGVASDHLVAKSLHLEISRMANAINQANITEYHKNAPHIHKLRCICPNYVPLRMFPSIANNNRSFKSLYLPKRSRDIEFLSQTVARLNAGVMLDVGDIRYLQNKFTTILDRLSDTAIRAYVSREFMDALDERLLQIPVFAQVYKIVFANK